MGSLILWYMTNYTTLHTGTECEPANSDEVTSKVYPEGGQPINLLLREETRMNDGTLSATVADLPPERLSELAGYLSGYPPDNPNSDEGSLLYWEMIAETLRRDLPIKFSSYTNIVSSLLNDI